MNSYKGILQKNREAVGMKPEWGPPVMMPGKDKMGQFIASLQTGLSIASSFTSLSTGGTSLAKAFQTPFGFG